MPSLTVQRERWPIAEPFVIARGAKTEAEVVVIALTEAPYLGRGEATPYPRYAETVEGVLAQIEAVRGHDRSRRGPRGPARAAAAGRRPQCSGLRPVGP